MRRYITILTTLIIAGAFVGLNAQKKSGYTFTDKIDIDVTSVKNQYRTGTCWCFATISFLEAELLREEGKTYDLSEMFVVRHVYAGKAEKYVRMHGKNNLGPGALGQDVMMVWEKYGMAPEEVYDGKVIGEENHVHGELDAVVKGFADEIIENKNSKITPVWQKAVDGILDAYLGVYPNTFTYEGKSYTPKSFAASLSLTPDDFVSIGSFSHQPFYKPFILEVPDNWNWNEIENVKLDEMMAVLDNALENGYTVCWDADVSEKGFVWGSGIALMPVEDIKSLDGLEQARWSELSEKEKTSMIYDFSTPKKEREITEADRQEWFDNYSTTDDHLMHITGTAVDQDGKKFYKVKNSWGVGNQIYEGYLYCSEAYMRAKTLFIMVNKKAVPKELAKKLDL